MDQTKPNRLKLSPNAAIGTHRNLGIAWCQELAQPICLYRLIQQVNDKGKIGSEICEVSEAFGVSIFQGTLWCHTFLSKQQFAYNKYEEEFVYKFFSLENQAAPPNHTALSLSKLCISLSFLVIHDKAIIRRYAWTLLFFKSQATNAHSNTRLKSFM